MQFRWIFFLPVILYGLDYRVDFVGLDNVQAIKSMLDASDLVILQDRPPASLNGIRYRVQGDLPALLKVLRAYGYYDGKISYTVDWKEHFAQVTLYIRPGPQYTIASYEVYHKEQCETPLALPCCSPLTPASLGLPIGSPALSVSIVNAELNLLTSLAECGYPLANVEKRKVIVDMQEKKVEAASCIDEGPLSKFGPLSIFGLKKVKPAFILDRVAWQEGELYRTIDVKNTQKRLLDSDLFSSVLISHKETLDEQGGLPIKMHLSEAKHRQVSFGPFYATVDGPGGVFNWSHRNLRGMGESIQINMEASKRYLAGTLVYKKPDVLAIDQTYRALGQIERQDIYAYHSILYRGANFFDYKVDAKSYLSVGMQVEHFNVTNSANNRSYLFFDLPMIFKYNQADDPLNPTRGYTLVYQPHFFQSLYQSSQQFIKQRITTTFYIPIVQKYFTFAGRVQLGSVAGTRQKNIPIPVLFLGGSEDDLRGYRYLTVSPLDAKKRPFGGRSAIFLSVETRFRIGNFGLVPFADFGTVTFRELPTVDAKWFKSLGIGLRYFTFFGPIRFDVGFPLDRRKGVDHRYRLYASIGQAY
ncbi:MAG: hypothetical protein A3D96_01880 [Chlamydiae bacterium RIFCSPHIGHO2_12_FULL_44_59]|nr:MAG: hypothetical protein A2796_04570 [Chlamydiae bacterium RIFCSPHIGHO2_01_FULL_44_39]OGN59293.1 MAG: hypothetical protein A3C42_04850 [Chlamydiae bacterium RIFCSPHIGHO2_02_FULL_45_9]OGN60659.1 MAG: hypothetical protein A3D96_01880 [Chlamydiae bacterium RIFCSPHIGHO2_12_FULL_44_59]OGN66919.1 MAG: hypothetical protein A2978_02110 [Chlamydiae bacterium RIFCSPLOWO2_01_FULL_44_52]OGN67471.1 MAG: hypothetical protein A3I67_03325 [Chlamydiae bacterium RIFCSPLOWO2_02_FULL_45_22]OGN71172.1 MAG: hyp